MRHLLLVALLALPLSAQQYLLPAAGNVQGANGTHFRSDISIWNFREGNQRIVMRWLPQGSTGLGLAPVEITLASGTGIQDEDFVGNILHRTGLGAILFQALRADGTPDTNARLTIQSRIWTPTADETRGFSSQSFDAIRVTQISGENRVITNQRSNFRYRMNVGVVNLDTTSAHTWQIVSDNATTEITVPPLSMHQVSIPRFNNGTTVPIVHIVGSGGGPSTWVAYGSSVDNVSGDGWTSLAYPGLP